MKVDLESIIIIFISDNMKDITNYEILFCWHLKLINMIFMLTIDLTQIKIKQYISKKNLLDLGETQGDLGNQL